MLIYWILFEEKPQALQDLGNYQLKVYKVHLEIPPRFSTETELETLEEINRIKMTGARYGRLPRHLRYKRVV